MQFVTAAIDVRNDLAKMAASLSLASASPAVALDMRVGESSPMTDSPSARFESAIPELPIADRNVFENRAWRLREEFRPTALTSEKETWSPNRPVDLKLDESQLIGPLWRFRLNSNQSRIDEISAVIKGKRYMFSAQAVVEFDQLAEDWASHPLLNGLTTAAAMRARLRDWFASTMDSGQGSSCVEHVLADFYAELGVHEIWVQISGITVETAFPMGFVEMRPVSAELVSTWVQAVFPSQDDSERQSALKERYARCWQGQSAAFYKSRGDRAAVTDAAIEYAERACALLRVLGPGMTNPSGRSFLQPISLLWQTRMREVLVDPQNPRVTLQSMPDRLDPLDFAVTEEILPALWQRGLYTEAHELLSANPPSAFQARLLSALLIFSRHRLTPDPVEKLVFAISATESILFAGDRNPRAPRKKRLAALLARTEDERVEQERILKPAYEMRHSFLHHGQTERGLTVVEGFLGLGFFFFRALLLRQREWPTVEAFAQAMDETYESRFGPPKP